MRFRGAFNPNHGKDGKFSSKGGGGGAGGAGGGGAASPGPAGPDGKRNFAPGSPGDVVQRALPGRKVLGVNERKFDADVLTEHKETFGGKTKTVKSTVQMLKVGDKWGIGDENAMASVFKKNGGQTFADAGTKVGGPGGSKFSTKKPAKGPLPIKSGRPFTFDHLKGKSSKDVAASLLPKSTRKKLGLLSGMRFKRKEVV